MTEEQQRIAIAEACGYTHVRIVKAIEGPPDIGIGHHPTEPHSIPDYLNDLNAMHEAEVVIIKSGYTAIRTYEDLLQKQIANIIFATAAQRAEAFLRTLNLWEE
jgi:hypothetical protein